MQIISTVRSLLFRPSAKFFCCLFFVSALTSCNSSTTYQEKAEESDLNPIQHVTHYITSPFKPSVEKDLRSLIHEVADQDKGCDSAPEREKLVSQLISPNSVQALQKTNTPQYWDKALPSETDKKQEVLDSVEQNLAQHMHNLKQSISATGLKIGEDNTKIVLLNTPKLPQTANIRASSLRFAPAPVLKHPGSLHASRISSKFSPVPVLKARPNAPVPLYKSVQSSGAKGGPFIPLRNDAEFSQRYRDLSATIKELVSLENLYTTLPIGSPMPGGLVTSGFGVRRDPFNRRWARHTGIDFSLRGTPAVHSTGSGEVIFAGYHRDYGNMVIIDHGHGLTSRYAHMSRIAVRKGQDVKDDTVVGYQGHTGRATGSHVHYEVRMNDVPIDPVNFVTTTPPVCRYKTASIQ